MKTPNGEASFQWGLVHIRYLFVCYGAVKPIINFMRKRQTAVTTFDAFAMGLSDQNSHNWQLARKNCFWSFQ
jgi:hypothetical protein